MVLPKALRCQRLFTARAFDQVVREFDQVVSVFDRHTQDRQDHSDGQGRCDQVHPVASSAGLEVVEHVGHDRTGQVAPPPDVLWREDAADEPAEPGVVRGVGVDQRAAGLESIGFKIPEICMAERGGE